MLKVQTEKEWFGIWGFSLHTKKKKTFNTVFAFINGRLQRCRLGVYFFGSQLDSKEDMEASMQHAFIRQFSLFQHKPLT